MSRPSFSDQHQARPDRRSFLKNAGALAAGLCVAQAPLPAGAGDAGVLHALPEGEPERYLKSRNELRYIGMPAGGLHTGTVYVGGDGRLWLWGIYNDDREGVDPKTVSWNDGRTERPIRSRDGACYVEPAIADNKRVLEQGFALKIRVGDKTFIRELKAEDWEEVAFEPGYPLATVRYTDRQLPADIVLRAGPLFIPLDAEASSLPATVLALQVVNRAGGTMQVSLTGWLENGARKVTARREDGQRLNQAVQGKGYQGVFSTFEAAGAGAAPPRDEGSTAIICLSPEARPHTDLRPWPATAETFGHHEQDSRRPPDDKLVGAAALEKTLRPGEAMEAHYVLCWHFNHPLKKLDRLPEIRSGKGYYYGTRFRDALEVAAYIAEHFSTLYSHTLRWQQTYYASTLPRWFLERSLLNIGTVATANTYRFADGRFWGWEGVNACEGTCTHVWQYAQALARIFPALERDTRERVDLGLAMQDDGGICFRAEYESRPAIDGQAGTILRIYREHQMSPDDSFLRRNWPRIKKAVRFMMAQDKNGDGMTDTPMENTLDAVWEGEIAWIVGLCIAAARAAERMAAEMGDSAFEAECHRYVRLGCNHMEEELFNGEYFIHRPDPLQGRKKLGSYNTCHIDQVYGQSWAFQAGLGRLWDREKTRSALRALWRYNFLEDVGPYILTHPGGRPYALAGEGGMLMNTNPRHEPHPYGEGVTWQLGYFHECMSGFEHQVASHMMAEGMVEEAMTLTRAIHDRYHPAKRNPYNEIECSDHYARAMASYGTFLSACGFRCHGPQGRLGFAPRVTPEHFRAAFTTAEGWGSYEQRKEGGRWRVTIELHYGRLRLRSLELELAAGPRAETLQAELQGRPLPAALRRQGTAVEVVFAPPVMLSENQRLQLAL